MKILLKNTTAEFVEKKSRFIANVFYVANANDAQDKLKEITKKYYDAKHNCFAYILGAYGNNKKSSDDGEPSGTAGHPMLDILKGYELTNVIAIVTRYFGGVLLGTGGLVRAYSESLKSALKNAEMSNIMKGKYISFETTYDDYGKIEKYVGNVEKEKIIIIEKKFEDKIGLKYFVNENLSESFVKDITEITYGKSSIDTSEIKCYNEFLGEIE